MTPLELAQYIGYAILAAGLAVTLVIGLIIIVLIISAWFIDTL